MAGAQFPRNLVAAVPYATHTVLPHNGAQFPMLGGLTTQLP